MSLPESFRAELWSFAEHLADVAGDIVRAYHAKSHTEIEVKEDGSPVTVADKECERRLRELIRQKYPEHGIIGEEFGSERAEAEFVWILDPIDGTKSFIPRVPLYGILFGVLHRGKPLLGVIDQPVLRERVIGDGAKTLFNGAPTRVKDTVALKDALLLTTDIRNVWKHHDEGAFRRLIDATGSFRTWGDCYGHLMVAAGRGDIMADPILNPWDLLPLLPILTGAGAKVTDWHGRDPLAGTPMNGSRGVIAAPPALHAAVMAKLGV